MVKLIKPTDDFPEDVLVLVGRITIRFGQLEHLMELTVKRLSGLSFQPGMALAQKLRTINKLRGRASDLFGHSVTDQGRKAEFDQLLERVGNLYSRRHSVIHALWGRDDQGRPVRIWRKKDWGVDLRGLQDLYDEVTDVL